METYTMGRMVVVMVQQEIPSLEWNNDVHYVAEFTLFGEIIPRMQKKEKEKEGTKKNYYIELISKRDEREEKKSENI